MPKKSSAIELTEAGHAFLTEARAVLESKAVPALLPGVGDDDASWAQRTAQRNRDGVPTPGLAGALGRARAVANRAFAETIAVEADGHGNGHGNGHVAAGEEHAAVGGGASGDGGSDGGTAEH